MQHQNYLTPPVGNKQIKHRKAYLSISRCARGHTVPQRKRHQDRVTRF